MIVFFSYYKEQGTTNLNFSNFHSTVAGKARHQIGLSGPIKGYVCRAIRLPASFVGQT